jgi:hypothetical protein
MPAADYIAMNNREPNLQAARILAAHQIPWSRQYELASLTLIGHALEAGEVRTPTILEPLLLVAKLAARPEEAMRLMTTTDLGEPFEIALDDDPGEAAAQLLEEILASIRALSPTALL